MPIWITCLHGADVTQRRISKGSGCNLALCPISRLLFLPTYHSFHTQFHVNKHGCVAEGCAVNSWKETGGIARVSLSLPLKYWKPVELPLSSVSQPVWKVPRKGIFASALRTADPFPFPSFPTCRHTDRQDKTDRPKQRVHLSLC